MQDSKMLPVQRHSQEGQDWLREAHGVPHVVMLRMVTAPPVRKGLGCLPSLRGGRL